MLTLAIPTIGSTTDIFLKDALLSAIDAPKGIVTEILISNDSRNEIFSSKLLDYQKQDDRIKIIVPSERQNQAGNFNFLLDNCQTEWILYLCDDDIVYGEKFSLLSNLMKKDLAFISGDFDSLCGSKKKTIRRNKGMKGILENTPKVVSTVINVDKLKKIGKWQNEDGYFMDLMGFIRLESQFKTAYINQVLGAFRQHAENASSRKNRYKGYANSLPHIISEGYKYLKESNEQREFTFHVVSYSYPHYRLLTRIVNKTLSFFGFKAWFLN